MNCRSSVPAVLPPVTAGSIGMLMYWSAAANRIFTSNGVLAGILEKPMLMLPSSPGASTDAVGGAAESCGSPGWLVGAGGRPSLTVPPVNAMALVNAAAGLVSSSGALTRTVNINVASSPLPSTTR